MHPQHCFIRSPRASRPLERRAIATDTIRHRPLSAEVEVRPARPEDAALLHLWRSEKTVRRYQPLAPLSTSQLRAELAARRADDLWRNRGDRFDWIVLVHRQPAGWITLVVHSWEHGLAECGYSLSTAFQGRGLMRRALARLIHDLFARTRLHRLEARTALANVASQKVLEKLGFHREGTLRGYFQLEGEWVDNYLFAIVKEDWLLQRSRRSEGDPS